MSAISHPPTPEFAMNRIISENRFRSARSGAEGHGGQTLPARLQVIHDLIRSGDYHVSAAAIADSMIEQMLFCRRRREA
jgi:anti-sigma28 factor (negative regulator of flagellin synthesis)